MTHHVLVNINLLIKYVSELIDIAYRETMHSLKGVYLVSLHQLKTGMIVCNLWDASPVQKSVHFNPNSEIFFGRSPKRICGAQFNEGCQTVNTLSGPSLRGWGSGWGHAMKKEGLLL